MKIFKAGKPDILLNKYTEERGRIMGETESTRTDCHGGEACNAGNESAPSSILPYYLSWYRLIFSPAEPPRDDPQKIPPE